jgi:hypothetical protein
MQVSRRTLIAMATGLLAGIGTSISSKAPRALTRSAGPTDYQILLDQLRPGDELRLLPGTYRDGLDLRNFHGTSENPIVISGPPDRSATFLGQPGHNTVELRNVSHVQIRNLTLDGRNTAQIDGVKAHAVTHHITLENMEILNYAGHQQTVGISTKAPAWNWVIRDNVIRHAGTGLYLGDSDGTAPFVHGRIERNLISHTIGYGLQIKHQISRPDIAELPSQPGSTIIRHNIISKAHQRQTGFQGPRPNLLVGHFPPRGPGVEDTYSIYGNLLYQNLVREPLFQGEGNVAFFNNLLVNHIGDGVWIQPHHDLPRKVSIFNNTIVAKGIGIAIRNGDPRFRQVTFGNAVFASYPIIGGERWNNFASHYATAETYLRAPFAAPPELDLRPRPASLMDNTLSLFDAENFSASKEDFAGNPREAAYLGAYAGTDVPKYGPIRPSDWVE